MITRHCLAREIMKTLKLSLLAASMAVLSGPSLAYEKGDVILRVGPAVVAPDSSSEMPGLGDVVKVDDGVSFGISGTYMMSDAFGLELLGSLPFEHALEGTGALTGVDIGSTQHLPPTLMINHYPGAIGRFNPYVGAGINRTVFFNEDTSAELDAVLGGPTSLELSSSTGMALQVGCDMSLGDNMSVSASVWSMDIDTTAKLDVGDTRVANIDVEIDPVVYMVGIGIQF